MDLLRKQVKELIVEALMIEDLDPAEIGDEQTLFGEGLGLDSVDALELAMEIERVFGVALPQSDESRAVFSNVSTLAHYIQQQQAA